ncbi:enoyl-CoA hydratase/isomerase family protein [Aestuariispira ectoiniformans]|uniref:enoyl-CoA hydratase/isomerase family protein n=1 Tax=Aestuariispira ectoiniformans TaxID=2775080 RepID=UPI00223B8498|nr:enoyl-CoA hydratase/isomerase family protein [Aestuariispira ectoiniformans]
MTQDMADKLVCLALDGPVARITLNRPDRHNSLVPELLEELLSCVDEVSRNDDIRAVVLQANGCSFSTGGDVQAFHDQGADIKGYARSIVGALNRCLLALMDCPHPVIGRIHGPVTGGSLGLLLACDLAVMSQKAFIQPYYCEVGFTPDGGWLAILPDRIGARQAGEIMLLNRRVTAADALRLGLVSAVAEDSQIDDWLDERIAELTGKVLHSLRATKKALWTQERRRECAGALDRELNDFIAHIDLPETWAGMSKFLGLEAKEIRNAGI